LAGLEKEGHRRPSPHNRAGCMHRHVRSRSLASHLWM